MAKATIKVVEKDGTESSIRFRTKRAAREAAALMNAMRNVRAAFVIEPRKMAMEATR